MKLSYLEVLVAAMRERSTKAGLVDPDVTFWVRSDEGIEDALSSGMPFVDVDLDADISAETLIEHISPADSELVNKGFNKGDIQLPLTVIKR